MPGEPAGQTALARLAMVADKLWTGEIRTQYAAICYRRTDDSSGPIEVLLITSRGTGRWVIPKGWPMAKKKPHEVASQEAWEEAGVRGRVRKKAWGHYTYVKRLGDGEFIPAMVQVHLLDVQRMEDDFPERHQRDLQWFSPRLAASAVGEPELRGLFARLEEREIQRAAAVASKAG
ncbi:NUDIX hydrolase [Agrobacterium rhizogenes]|uniref:DNA mismatch repair protein MutT n=6 Tax=Rhizobium/Agrobacterium group TaxID=227290 RepID=A0A2Z2PQU7_RHIRH|nr:MULTISPECIES: NUDIX hydrolase [Rhizobium/Agrobacterium group]OCJ08386.1 DNA mismatch repair protein MutT [Agrobacterium sp. B131/95]OCJ28707.1 DNA mismatch repair protein MutT [Agrobacterium sp. B133/95]ASK44205.1 DNA mismatch repair protein MutT [Rhizobium rhizogenes]ASK44760.1 DNA mismatch repair protein MutT [Rhizobium rhizogenes]ASK45025.1 DNA mismatch repair protein MutT [Rhizobium rhizogenes]